MTYPERCEALYDALKALVAAVERDDNQIDEGHSSMSPEMEAARKALERSAP